MKIIYSDKDILVVVKPSGVLSTDEPGGMPALLREELRDGNADIRTVHRLDRVVGGLMVFARSQAAAASLSRQITEKSFRKEYMAVIHGSPEADEGRFDDLLFRSAAENKTAPSFPRGRCLLWETENTALPKTAARLRSGPPV